MQSHGIDAMEEDTVDESVHDTSTEGRAIGNDGSLPEQITIHDSNQVDDDCSLQTFSDLSLTKEPYQKLENDLYCNQNYLKHFFEVPQSLRLCLLVPETARHIYLFLYKDDMYDTDVHSMSRETENEYVIINITARQLRICVKIIQREKLHLPENSISGIGIVGTEL
eukprot:3621857-Ditylum_brightwellii.AAC.1